MELARIPFSLEPHATLRGLEARSGPRGLLEAGEPLQEQEKPGKGRNQRRWRDPGQRTCRRGRGMVGGAGVGGGSGGLLSGRGRCSEAENPARAASPAFPAAQVEHCELAHFAVNFPLLKKY